MAGGLYDVLRASDGCAWAVDNFHLFHAARTFREMEGVDIGPASAVAVNALRQAVKSGSVTPTDRVLLHITGGGREIQHSEGKVYPVEPTIVIRPSEWEKAASALGEPAGIPGSPECLKRYE
jgi:hypothetical protein